MASAVPVHKWLPAGHDGGSVCSWNTKQRLFPCAMRPATAVAMGGEAKAGGQHSSGPGTPSGHALWCTAHRQELSAYHGVVHARPRRGLQSVGCHLADGNTARTQLCRQGAAWRPAGRGGGRSSNRDQVMRWRAGWGSSMRWGDGEERGGDGCRWKCRAMPYITATVYACVHVCTSARGVCLCLWLVRTPAMRGAPTVAGLASGSLQKTMSGCKQGAAVHVPIGISMHSPDVPYVQPVHGNGAAGPGRSSTTASRGSIQGVGGGSRHVGRGDRRHRSAGSRIAAGRWRPEGGRLGVKPGAAAAARLHRKGSRQGSRARADASHDAVHGVVGIRL